MKRIRKCASREDGSIMILFAGFLVVIIGMIGLMLDLGMIYMRRNDLMDLCQFAREERFNRQDSIRYADNPGKLTYEIVSKSVRENGFRGQVKVFFLEREPKWNKRSYQVRIVLSEEYSYTFLRLFHLNTTPITVYLDGGEEYGEDSDDMIWHSNTLYSDYNGSYTGTNPADPTTYVFTRGEHPADWTT